MPSKKKAGKSSAEYYKDSKESLEKKRAYQREYNKKPEQVEKRKELVKLNREKGTYGNGDGKDVAHTKNGKTRLQDASKNRGDKKTTSGDRRARGGKKK